MQGFLVGKLPSGAKSVAGQHRTSPLLDQMPFYGCVSIKTRCTATFVEESLGKTTSWEPSSTRAEDCCRIRAPLAGTKELQTNASTSVLKAIDARLRHRKTSTSCSNTNKLRTPARLACFCQLPYRRWTTLLLHLL